MTDKKLEEAAALRISKTRSALLIKEPFFGLMALRLKLKPTYDPKIPIMGVSKTTLYFNPVIVNVLPKHSLYFIVAHEIMHIVLLHHFRMQKLPKYKDITKVNFAQDYAINIILHDEGFQVPDAPYGPLLEKSYRGMSAEQIFEVLPDTPPTPEMLISSNIGTVVNENTSPEQTKLDERLIKQSIAEAKDASKMQGRLPGSIEEIVEEVLEIKIDWKAELSIYFKERVRDGYTWSRPNRRFINEGIYLPSHLEVPTGDIVVCIDTSGSLDNDQLAEFMSELNGILQFAKPKKVTVVQCDTVIHSIEEYTPADYPIKVTAEGRGGTDFNPVFNQIASGDIDEPSVLVYFTDLWSNFPKEEPHYSVLWLVSENDKANAPFGTTIHI